MSKVIGGVSFGMQEGQMGGNLHPMVQDAMSEVLDLYMEREPERAQMCEHAEASLLAHRQRLNAKMAQVQERVRNGEVNEYFHR